MRCIPVLSVTSSPARSKRMKPTSAARRGTCMLRSGPRKSPALAARTRLPLWESWSAAARSGPRSWIIPRKRPYNRKSANTFSLALRSSDALKSYEGLDEFQHEVVDHAVEYVRGEVHTNGLENFWSLLKRGINGTYVSVEPFHLFRYLDEQAFRYNNRKGLNDGERFDLAVRQIVGKRLTFDQLTCKTAQG